MKTRITKRLISTVAASVILAFAAMGSAYALNAQCVLLEGEGCEPEPEVSQAALSEEEPQPEIIWGEGSQNLTDEEPQEPEPEVTPGNDAPAKLTDVNEPAAECV